MAGFYFGFKKGPKDRAFVSNPGANNELSGPALLNLVTQIQPKPKIVHFGGYFTMIGTYPKHVKIYVYVCVFYLN